MIEIYEIHKVIRKKNFSDNEIKLIAKKYKEYLKYYESSYKDNYKTFLYYFDTYTEYYSLGNEIFDCELIDSNLNQLYNEVKKYL